MPKDLFIQEHNLDVGDFSTKDVYTLITLLIIDGCLVTYDKTVKKITAVKYLLTSAAQEGGEKNASKGS